MLEAARRGGESLDERAIEPIGSAARRQLVVSPNQPAAGCALEAPAPVAK
jgi:hypothetical protein